MSGDGIFYVMNFEVESIFRKWICVLLFEDCGIDVEIMIWELCWVGFELEWEWVEDEVGFCEKFDLVFDLILVDYNLLMFDGLWVFDLVMVGCFDILCIIVFGVLGDELVVECIKCGVVDYLLKDWLVWFG